ncbi:TetR/AcrR family transcriptional regulator [Actinacidiphila sp. bgisy167]|uniref:TetR/AcrR family transcriptional regulator n=1 Tax=Actinacidiphila sp. bgisy167 TaxID=3413797 RepID=UPI003D718A4E
MGHSQAAKAESREKVLRIAARRIREEGMARPGVADLMKEAGLTHGGFYKHFSSRDDLMAQAAALALADGEHKMAEAARKDPEAPRSGLIDAYLSSRHRDAPGTGCALVTLGASAGRGDEALKESYELQVRRYLELIGEAAQGDDPDDVRADAMVTLSALVGALLMSRAVADPELSDEILATVAGRLKGTGARVPAEV